MFRVRPHRTTTLFGAALLAALALTACAGGSNDTSSASSVAARDGGAPGQSKADSGAAPQSGGASNGLASGGSGVGQGAKTDAKTSQSVTPAALQATQEQLARRASIALQVKNIGQAVAKVRAAAAAAQGIVLSENIGTGDGAVPLTDSSRVSATTYGEITISVPSTQLDTVVADLGALGKVIRSTSSSEDVGAQIVDTQSRLQTMRVSVERVRSFLEHATDLSQTVQMEAELTRRQSDLEAMEAQLASLKGSVARSPVQVSLTTEPGVIAQPQTATGFLAGLKGGWHAFTSSVAVVLTVLGALLPFAVVLALLGFPAWLLIRRRRTVTPPPTVLPE